MNPSPLRKLRHKKGWRLNEVEKKLIEKGTPVSWPTLLKIDHGFNKVIIRDIHGNILKEEKRPYKPSMRILSDIGKLFKKPAKEMYEDRSKD